MRVLHMQRGQVYKGPLILVNRQHPIREDVRLDNLRPVGNGIMLEKETAAQLEVLLASSDEIVSVSGFRSRQEQELLYQDCLSGQGRKFTEKYVASPRCSEHESGLAIDLGVNQKPIDFVRPAFPYKGACQDFRKKAPYYGFIQRYEKGKERITGIAHEPWHFRYVGFPHSLIMEENYWSLEEYLAALRKKKVLLWKCGSRTMEIRYVNGKNAEELTVEIPEGKPYQISGDNMGGLVLTLL